MVFRIQVASDLHHEFLATANVSGAAIVTPVKDADLVIMAGDIDVGDEGIRRYDKWQVPVVYIDGNHEFDGLEMLSTREQLQSTCTGTSVRYMERTRLDRGPVHIRACTLWTDYILTQGASQDEQLEMVQNSLNDHRRISLWTARFTAREALEEHQASRRWPLDQILVKHQGKTVVVTHVEPHPGSVHPRYDGSLLNAAFVSDLSIVLDEVDLGIHGHVHESFDAQLEPCRVVADPLGYPVNRGSAKSELALKFENSGFQRELVVDV